MSLPEKLLSHIIETFTFIHMNINNSSNKGFISLKMH